MKHIVSIVFLFAALAVSASPFDPTSATEVAVYSPASASPLHVRGGDVSRTFDAAHTGHRSVCAMPGTSTNDTFSAWIGGDAYALGDPFGVSTGRAYPSVELTRTTSIMPRINVFADESDRLTVYGDAYRDTNGYSSVSSLPTAEKVRVRVVRARVDERTPYHVGVRDARIFCDRYFTKGSDEILHEGDILSASDFDIDWELLYSEVVTARGIVTTGTPITNVNYCIFFGNETLDFDSLTATNANFQTHPIIINRRFEVTRTIPTAVGETVRSNAVSVAWKIVGEDPWASAYGTSYTAYRADAYLGTATNGAAWQTSGVCRMPPADTSGVYRHVFREVPNNTNFTWRVFTYNSKFKEDYSESWNGDVYENQYGGSEMRSVTISY